MNNKTIKGILFVTITIFVLFFIYRIFTFQLFNNDLQLIDKLPVNNSDYSVLLYRFPSSATIEGAIQIHLIHDDSGDSRFFENYDRYNAVVFSEITRERSLLLVLQDTNKSKVLVDTIRLELPNKY